MDLVKFHQFLCTGEQAVADGLTDDLLNSVWNAVPPGSDSIKSSKGSYFPYLLTSHIELFFHLQLEKLRSEAEEVEL